MDTLLASPAVQQVPGLVIMAFVVTAFIKYLKTRDAFILDMHKEHMLAREQSRAALESNANATRSNTQALNDLSESVAHFKRTTAT